MATNRQAKKQKKKSVWKKSNGRCSHCGALTGSRNRTVDHYIPKSKGGTMDSKNLLPVCRNCNKARGNMDVVPEKYYKYAEPWAIRELKEYEREFNERNRSMSEKANR